MNKRTQIGKFIHTTWTNLNIRCKNGKYRRLSKKNECYHNITLDISNEDFKNLCINNSGLILSLHKPSIDRINKNIGYTLNNIQFIELKDNIAKDKTVFTENTGRCWKCKTNKEIKEFCKDRRRRNGYTSICRICDKERKLGVK